jgi:HD-GYP domain-containing protein (c-di-GMP phosphodiesterase class II)
MANKPQNTWDSRREREIRQTMNELKLLEEAGYFQGLTDSGAVPDELKVQAVVTAQMTRAAPFLRKVAQYKPLDYPVVPALSQFMTQLSVRDRSEMYKTETYRKFEDAVAQVRILFGKIVRREIASNAVIRSIVGSFMDAFMKDRNLILNLASAPYSGPDYLYDHSLKLCLLSLSLASAAGYSRTQTLEVAQGALLADVGMMLVPERIRLKRGKLSESESFEMRKHPTLGIALLEPVHGLSEATLLVPYQHHERLSGSGYPDNRAGNTVSKFSRIVAIADVFTALINKRTYHEPLVPYQAMVSLLAMGGSGLLDGDQIKHFLRAASIFPLGSLVRLSDGRVGKVVAPNPSEFTKPQVSVLTALDGTLVPKNAIRQIDLAASDEKIVEALTGQAITHHVLDGF